MAHNTLAAYRTDLLQFFAWFEKSGTRSLFKVDLKFLARYLEIRDDPLGVACKRNG